MDIDNEIEPVSRQSALDDELLLENKENEYRIGFANKSTASKLVRFQLNEAYVDFGLVEGKEVDAVHEDNQVSYPSVFPNVDLVYHTGNTSVKEEWVLHSYDGKRKSFTMTLNTEGVEAKPQKDGSIDFLDAKGKAVFTIPRPFMIDDNLRYSDNIQFTIREEGNQTFLDLSLDQEWLQDPERAYPVRVDPSIVIQGKYKTYDSFVGSKDEKEKIKTTN
ncbi:hypothetical protein [Desmospora activa]|uniref:Uncharacterized protein n=1 Tax=Desmospora activa DSM 45169 TaxID=1121389 RepID=A0A2T4ZD28_9BACL|nr:hypothetical protein [Desmospora activa]PTM59793.1 hypothetical protein C8J48_2425 [Desmospora activa DSM 45169]